VTASRVKRLVGTMVAVAVGVAVAAAPSPGRAVMTADLAKVELMLHGVTAVYASAVMTMQAYRAGLLTKEEASTEIGRNERFLAVLTKCGKTLEREAAPGDDENVSLAKDFLQVCSYLELALGSFEDFVSDGNDIDRKLVDRYLFKCEQTMTRLLRNFSGE